MLNFAAVHDLASKLWDKHGLIRASQKNTNTFLFKFNSLVGKSDVLARGTWHFNRRPLVLSDWGPNLEDKTCSDMHLWVKFGNIPDCFWMKDGLGHIASAIGEPICADHLTSQLEVVPFPRICVKYHIGNELPAKILITSIDAFGVKSIIDVNVDYERKPLICSGCKALGHKGFFGY